MEVSSVRFSPLFGPASAETPGSNYIRVLRDADIAADNWHRARVCRVSSPFALDISISTVGVILHYLILVKRRK